MTKPVTSRRDLQYDVCLSFAGEDRDYAEEVANRLTSLGVRVFYDRYEEVELWGKDLYSHLDDVYQNAARYCVLFISEHYAKKLWPNHERRSAQARAFREHQEYLLPARFDDSEIPGIPATVAYIDLRDRTPQEFAGMINEKLGDEQRTNYFPPYPDLLLHRIDSDEDGVGRDHEEVLSRARHFYDVLTRMTPDERSVVASVFLHGCPAELPENIHVNLDLLRRYTQFPVSRIKRLLGAISSLGFYSKITDESHGHDEYLGEAKYLYLEWHNLHTSAPGNATYDASHVIWGAISGYCEIHGLQALERLDFSQLASPTEVVDDHD